MGFFKKKNLSAKSKRHDINPKKKFRRIVFLVFLVLFLIFFSYVAYLIASGSKIFENGLGGQSLLKTLYGKEKLKGEDENRVNILLMGMGGGNHDGAFLTDSIMVLSVRPSDKKVAILSIPRDLYVKIPNFNESKINAAFHDGYSNYMSKQCKNKKNTSSCADDAFAAGALLSSDTISSTLNIPIHYYATADFSGFEKLINQLGGIDINVEKAIYDPYFPDKAMKGYEPFRIKAGEQHLNGETALKYARSRQTTNDFDRAARQQKVIAAAKDKAVSGGILSNPKKLADIVSTLGNSVKTNFSPGELKALISMIENVSNGDIITEVLSNAPDGLLVDHNNGTYYLKPKGGNFKAIQDLAANIFDRQKRETAKIEIQNGSTTSGLGGRLAQDMQDDGYTITSISTAKQKALKTLIYDLSGGNKKITSDYLAKKLNSKILPGERKTGETADFRIIIGEDYIPND